MKAWTVILACLGLLATGCGTETGNALCPESVVVDGVFTDFPRCLEYPDAPARGVFGNLYMRYDDGILSVLNAWFHRDDAPIHPTYYNRFDITTGDGAQEWVVKVFGDNRIEVTLNGQDYVASGVGASGFEMSPLHDFPHTLFEFQLEVEPGFCTLKEADPAPGASPETGWSPEDALVEEPSVFAGELLPDGGSTVAVTEDSVLAAYNARPAPFLGEIRVRGYQLGEFAGTVSVGGDLVDVRDWDDGGFTVVLPRTIPPSGDIVANTTRGVSNPLPYALDCGTQCPPAEERECANGEDDDRDARVDCADPDCWRRACNDTGAVCRADSTCACPQDLTPSNELDLCDDGIDNDCDGLVDCQDSDCEARLCSVDDAGQRCSEGICQCWPTQPNLEQDCGNGRDDDCDGLIDCQDSDCSLQLCGAPPSTRTCNDGQCHCAGAQDRELTCFDGVDNDCDGAVDCADSDCNDSRCDILSELRLCQDARCVCASAEFEGELSCGDGIDNDCDGLTDCSDESCMGRSCRDDHVCDKGRCCREGSEGCLE